nr:efflux RND transporter periplasmic adaptor subunit [Nitrospirillum amazonense]
MPSEVAGVVQQISVRTGDTFQEGQVLVTLDCASQKAQLQEAQAALTAATQLKAINERTMIQSGIGALAAATAAAEAVKAEASVRTAQQTLTKCSIKAPFAGRVVEQKVQEHEYVQVGQPLLQILDDSGVEVEFEAPPWWLAWLKPGTAFQVAIAETGRLYPAHITRTGAMIAPGSHAVKVMGEINGRTPELVAGMDARLIIKQPK